MSHSPSSPADTDSLLAYRNAWQATNRLLRQGHSFSGHEANCVYLNCRGSQFANVSSVTGLNFIDDGRALGVTDWDQDGDLDVWLGNRTGPRLRLMRNSTIAEGANHTDHAYVAFRLRGTKSNRDAIGARVAVQLASRAGSRAPSRSDGRTPVPPKLIQTLRAGDAFLSQSSKWLHFGLGPQAEVAQVEVHWPSGHMEQFPNIHAGRRFELVEGSGQAIALPPASREIALVPGHQAPAPSPPASRMYFSSRVPMPLLTYEPFDGVRRSTVNIQHPASNIQHPASSIQHPTSDIRHLTPIASSGRPLLITLWASWCQPCLVELHEMAQQAESLRRAGLDVLALSVDGLDASQPTTAADARAALERLKFPFAGGTATPEMLDKLSVAESLVMNYQKGLAVPTSYLFDSEGHLAVAYKGSLDLAQLQQDVSQVDVPLAERRNLAAAMPGRWITPPRQLLMRAVARAFRDHGYDADFTRYLKLDAQVIERQLATARTDHERQELTETFAAANFNLGMTLASSGDVAEAVNFFQQTIELEPDHVEALINLGALYGRARNSELAVKLLQRAVELSLDSIPARLNLAVALTASGEFAAAVPHYEKVLSSEPNNASAHSQLARSLIELGRIESAAEHLEKAVQLNPQDFAATLTLAWLQATSPIDTVRDGESALMLAQRLQSGPAGENPMVLDVLAACFAEQGDFESAKATIHSALTRLSDANPAIRQTLLARLKQYEANQPHRDEDGKYP